MERGPRFFEFTFMALLVLRTLPLSIAEQARPSCFFLVSKQSAAGIHNPTRAQVLKENAKSGFAGSVVFCKILDIRSCFQGYAQLPRSFGLWLWRSKPRFLQSQGKSRSMSENRSVTLFGARNPKKFAFLKKIPRLAVALFCRRSACLQLLYQAADRAANMRQKMQRNLFGVIDEKRSQTRVFLYLTMPRPYLLMSFWALGGSGECNGTRMASYHFRSLFTSLLYIMGSAFRGICNVCMCTHVYVLTSVHGSTVQDDIICRVATSMQR